MSDNVTKEQHNWVGRILGTYKIESEIGIGGMSRVYRAYQPQLERWVALKVLKTRHVGQKGFLARFHREAKSIAHLRHPNILTVYDYGEEDGMPYIVIEHVPGGTFKDLISAEDPMPIPKAIRLIEPVALALAYAHKEGVVHCDVKPANILMVRPDWPLLADFGLARLLGRDEEGRRNSMTGTPAYFSPEQVSGDLIDNRTDIYGMGIVLYELLTGHLPFNGRTPVDAMLSRLTNEPIAPTIYNPAIPARLEKVILTALSRDKDDRYESMEQFIDAVLTATNLKPISNMATGTAVFDKQQPSTGQLNGPHLISMGTGAVLPLPIQSEMILGRFDAATSFQPDIDLGPHGGGLAGVSRQHARILSGPTGWLLQDFGSTNGTYVNELRLTPEQLVPIQSGDMIKLGRMQLTFQESRQIDSQPSGTN